MSQTVRAENVDETNRAFVYLSKKNKSVKATYLYAPESSHYTLSENGMVYGGLSHRS